MNLIPALKNVSDAYSVRRTVDFDTIGVKIGLRNLSAVEEVKVLESCKDFEGAQYLQTLKRNSLSYAIESIDGNKLPDEIQLDNGAKVSRFMFLCGYLDEWPSAIRDVLFEVFTDMSTELEKKVADSAKFTRYSMSTPDFKETKPLFRRVEEKEEPETEADLLKKKVEEEIDSENSKINRAGT